MKCPICESELYPCPSCTKLCCTEHGHTIANTEIRVSINQCEDLHASMREAYRQSIREKKGFFADLSDYPEGLSNYELEMRNFWRETLSQCFGTEEI